MFRNANNNFFAFVCNHTATDANAIAGTTLEVGDLVNGDVVLVDKDNNILADSDRTGVSGLTFKIATKAGGKLFYSPLVTYGDCTVTTGNRAAAVQQVTNIGGTTAGTGGYLLPDVASDDTAAAAQVGNSFYALIEKQDNDEANRSGYAPAITAQVKMKSTSGSGNFTFTTAEELQVNLAAQLREAIATNDALEAGRPSVKGPKYLRAKVVANVATQADCCTTDNITLTHGSKTVTAAGAFVAGIVVGDYLNVAGDLYKITADPATGTTMTLEDAYRGPSEVIVSGTAADEVGFNTAAQVNAATAIGIQLEGQAQHEFDVNRHRSFSASRFNVRFAKDGENVGATITRTTAASEGLGEYQQVAFEEYESFGALGQRWVSDTPASFKDANTEVDTVFGLISLREVTTKQNSLIGQTLGKTTYHLWIELESGVVDGANSCQDVLLTQLNLAASTVQ